MKSKKLILPIIIMSLTILAMVIFSVVFCIAKKPVITEGEFEFTITYELDGETHTIEDVMTVRYEGNDGYSNTKYRNYSGKIGSLDRDDVTKFVFKESETECLFLETGLCADCLMGDPKKDCPHSVPMAPQLVYDDEYGMRYRDEETLMAQGARLVSWEYPEPIENEFVFSHMSNMSGEVVVYLLAISLLALIVTIIFVKKEKDLTYNHVDQVSIVFNFLISLIALPFVTICTLLMDIVGGTYRLSHQMLYFSSAVIVICIAASIALRRKGFRKSSFIVQFGGPAFFILLLLFNSIGIF